MPTFSYPKRFLLLLSLVAVAFSTQAQSPCSGTVLTVTAPVASISGTIGSYSVASGGPYKIRITAQGAKGGNATGGAGATMIGEFVVLSGQVLNVSAGAPGGDGPTTFAGGGGGGSGVLLQGDVLLILAGGGGGGSLSAGGGATTALSGAGNGGSSSTNL